MTSIFELLNEKKRVIMFQFIVFLILSVAFANNYAIVYASVEPWRDSNLPSSACRIINVFAFSL